MKLTKTAILVAAATFLAPASEAMLMLGPISDFEDGTLQGWAPPAGNTTNIATGGPAGAGDNFLQIAPAQRLSAFNAGVNGVISPDVLAIELDIMRPAGLFALDIRLVLFGPGGGNRWTSSASQVIPSDGIWRHYAFSILEVDLTRVLGAGSYVDLTNNLNRIQFRHDTGGPSPGGTPVAPGAGTFGIDNVVATGAVPEPSTVLLMSLGLIGLGAARRFRARR